MRLFLIADSNGQEMVDVIRILEKNSHQVIYWCGLATGEEKKFPRVIFHSHFDARQNILPHGFNLSDFPPITAELIKQLIETESLVGTMMFKQFRNIPFEHSRHIYYEMIQYWHGVIEKYQPEAIIFTVMPHHVYNYVIYALAKLIGIKTIFFEDTWLYDRALVYDDFWQGSRRLHHQLEQDKGKNFSISDLAADIQAYYEKQLDCNKGITPAYMQYQKKKHTGRGLWLKRLRLAVKYIRQGAILKIIFQHILKRFGQNLKKEYQQLQVQPDLDKPYVYVPLNYQPERTTSPQGGVFVDQILMLATLSASLPTGWVIYVKEHPTQWWRDGMNYTNARYQGYYQSIAKLKNVKLVPINANSHVLIKQSRAVATVTGTAGFESLIFSKPTLVFGYPWYRDCPGLFKINNISQCQSALRQIQAGYQVDPKSVINYLHSLDAATIHCTVDDFDNPKLSPYSREQRIENFAKAVLAQLA